MQILNLIGQLLKPLRQDHDLFYSPRVVLLAAHGILFGKAGVSEVLAEVLDGAENALLRGTLLDDEVVVSPLVVHQDLLVGVYHDLRPVIKLLPLIGMLVHNHLDDLNELEAVGFVFEVHFLIVVQGGVVGLLLQEAVHHESHAIQIFQGEPTVDDLNQLLDFEGVDVLQNGIILLGVNLHDLDTP